MTEEPTAGSDKVAIAKATEQYANIQKAFYEVMKNPRLVHPDLQKALTKLNDIAIHLNGTFDGKVVVDGKTKIVFEGSWQDEAIRLTALANKSLAEVAAGAGKRDPSAYIGTEKVTPVNKEGPSLHLAFPGSPRSDKYAWTPLYEMGG